MRNSTLVISGRLFSTPELVEKPTMPGFKTILVKGVEVPVLEVDIARTDVKRLSVKNDVTGETNWFNQKAKVVVYGQPAIDLFANALAGDEIDFAGYWEEEKYFSKCTGKIETAKRFVVPENRCAEITKRGRLYTEQQKAQQSVEDAFMADPGEHVDLAIEREEARQHYGY